MSQAEDTELRDLVMEALEKNGSLAKLRARLRSDIYTALEDEETVVNGNPELEQTLSTSEGVLSLLLVQEFLEYNNLFFTMFLYKAETGQGKGYVYEGRSHIADQFKSGRVDKSCRSSILTQLLKCVREKDFNLSSVNADVSMNNKKDHDVLNVTCIVHDNSPEKSEENEKLSFNSTEYSVSDKQANETSRIVTDDTVGSLSHSSVSEDLEIPKVAIRTKRNGVHSTSNGDASTAHSLSEEIPEDIHGAEKSESSDSVIASLIELTTNNKNTQKVTIRGEKPDTRSDSLEINEYFLEDTDNSKDSYDLMNIINSSKVTMRKNDLKETYERNDSFDYDPDLTEEWQDD